jgi:hypothetical protein
LLDQAGMLNGLFSLEAGSPIPRPLAIKRLTWKGHEYLESVRSDTLWSDVKKTAREKGVDLTIDLVKALATAKARALLGMPPA